MSFEVKKYQRAPTSGNIFYFFVYSNLGKSRKKLTGLGKINMIYVNRNVFDIEIAETLVIGWRRWFGWLVGLGLFLGFADRSLKLFNCLLLL